MKSSEDKRSSGSVSGMIASEPLPSPVLPFPIVGIGASAGGLPALIALFEQVSEQPGMAFVVVQHLPPDRESFMADILAGHCRLPVRQIEEGLAAEIDTVYLI